MRGMEIKSRFLSFWTFWIVKGDAGAQDNEQTLQNPIACNNFAQDKCSILEKWEKVGCVLAGKGNKLKGNS